MYYVSSPPPPLMASTGLRAVSQSRRNTAPKEGPQAEAVIDEMNTQMADISAELAGERSSYDPKVGRYRATRTFDGYRRGRYVPNGVGRGHAVVRGAGKALTIASIAGGVYKAATSTDPGEQVEGGLDAFWSAIPGNVGRAGSFGNMVGQQLSRIDTGLPDPDDPSQTMNVREVVEVGIADTYLQGNPLKNWWDGVGTLIDYVVGSED